MKDPVCCPRTRLRIVLATTTLRLHTKLMLDYFEAPTYWLKSVASVPDLLLSRILGIGDGTERSISMPVLTSANAHAEDHTDESC